MIKKKEEKKKKNRKRKNRNEKSTDKKKERIIITIRREEDGTDKKQQRGKGSHGASRLCHQSQQCRRTHWSVSAFKPSLRARRCKLTWNHDVLLRRMSNAFFYKYKLPLTLFRPYFSRSPKRFI